MTDTTFVRDLLVIGAVFGVAAFAWAGWGQERPPRGWWWRAALVVLQLAGAALAAVAIIAVATHLDAPTALESGSAALVGFIVVFWLEVAFIVGFAVFFARTGRSRVIAPSVLIVVGVHFVPLSIVFGQPVLIVAAVILTAAAVASIVISERAAPRAIPPERPAAASFWCGVFAAPVFLVVGVWALAAGQQALAS